MKLLVYTVYDKGVQAYLQPFYCRAQGEALRSFTEACNDPANNFRRHASDYVLMRMGEFDDASGLFTCSEPVRVISAVECIADSGAGEERAPVKPAGTKRVSM